jgi:superfamily II DNA helicase RecQ
MSQDEPSPPSPDAPSDRRDDASALDVAFDAMLLNPTFVANGDFSDDWDATDTEEALAMSSVDDARLKDCIAAASASVWGVPTMRPGQLEACFRLLHSHRPNSLMVVHRTGGGKTHILRTLGVIERGIILMFIPLLTLSADVMHKFESADPTWGNVGVYHLDELFDCNRSAYHQLLRRCSSIDRTMTSTLFLFLSPQFLINHPNALGVFVTCAQERTLRLIAMDEVHIHVQHGTSFLEEIRALRVEFFRRVYGNQPRDRQPRLIALTATFPSSYLPMLSTLLTVDFSISHCILRGSSVEFQQREIEMRLEMCSKKAQFVGKVLSQVAEFLQRNLYSSVVIFCNSRKQSQHIAVQLEKKLDLMKLSVDVVNINRSLDKIDKFWRI